MKLVKATVICMLFAIMIFITTSYHLKLFDHFNQSFKKENGLKYILLYTPYFQQKDWYFGLGHEPFVNHRCEVRNCFVTNNPDYLENQSDYDAILFHMRDFKRFPDQTLRRSGQVYVMFLMESPLNSQSFANGQSFKGIFNWTMTYRRDSTIKSPYGWVVPINDPNLGPYTTNLLPSNKTLPRALTSVISAKNKSVAWIASNCQTHSKREDYVAELKKHIDVDTYGRCGQHICSRDGSENCVTDIHKKYKFYLAFENSLCRDYVTEKFWNSLDSSMIPVVLGGANYSTIAPPDSYIDASQCKPKELAALLKNMETDELLDRLSWKANYMVRPRNTTHNKFCDLCKKLNDPERKDEIYEDISYWWSTSDTCKPGFFSA